MGQSDLLADKKISAQTKRWDANNEPKPNNQSPSSPSHKLALKLTEL